MAGERLEVLEGPAQGTSIALDEEFEIGRAAAGEGRLNDDPDLSRDHARISRRDDGRLEIQDLGSTNGTFVNGQRINTPTRLSAGDRVRVGTTVLQIVGEGGRVPGVTRYDGGAQPTVTPSPAPPPPPRPPAPSPIPASPPAFARPAPPPSNKGRNAGIGFGVFAIIAAAIVVLIVVLGQDDGSDNTASTTPADSDAALTPAQIIEANRRSVVRISTKRPEFDEDTFREIEVEGGGTGIVIDAAKGLVLTNHHVVDGTTSRRATLADEPEVRARILGQAPCEDLAVIQLTPRPDGLRNADLGMARTVKAGDELYALGYPSSFEEDLEQRRLQLAQGSATAALGQASLGANLPKLEAAIENQVPSNGGNSGGPLLDAKGDVIGIVTVGTTSGQNQNAAIAIERARALLPELVADKNLGYAGWSLQLGTIGGDVAPIVRNVAAGSPADRGEIEPLDVIRRIDNTNVSTIPEICDILASKSPGDGVKVEGRTIRLTAGGLRLVGFESRFRLR